MSELLGLRYVTTKRGDNPSSAKEIPMKELGVYDYSREEDGFLVLTQNKKELKVATDNIDNPQYARDPVNDDGMLDLYFDGSHVQVRMGRNTAATVMTKLRDDKVRQAEAEAPSPSAPASSKDRQIFGSDTATSSEKA